MLTFHAALVANGMIEPLSRDIDDTRLWMDCELASLVENRFFERLDPRALTPELRDGWETRAACDGGRPESPHEHAWYTTPYWIIQSGERVGTIGLSTTGLGSALVTISSLYVLPSCRGRHIARDLLRRAHDATRAHGARGLRVPTHWTWQPAVRFYLGLGMWIANWKRSLVFTSRPRVPEHRIEVTEREARFGVVLEGRTERLITASREGDRLRWVESPRMESLRGEHPDVYHLGPETFAVALALHGFPLIRSPEHWEKRKRWSDGGEPEGLAHKIEIFEAIDRSYDFEVRTPRIPGLLYRRYDEID